MPVIFFKPSKNEWRDTHLYLFIALLLWLIVDIVQACVTELHADEAYYALYGEYLSWGYHDHPPMVALLAHISAMLGGGNMAVRLCAVLLHTGTLLCCWYMLRVERNRDNLLRFLLLAGSMVMLTAYGFLSTPDAPLLFFTALFFLIYRLMQEPRTLSQRIPLALLFGVSMAGMVYSKYTALLIIVFVLLSNIKVLRRVEYWLAAIITFVLMMPHLLWQVEHDFPAITAQANRIYPFSFSAPLEYIPNQLVVFNPLCFVLMLWIGWRRRKQLDDVSRAYLVTFLGLELFFWLSTVKGHAEPHWTVAATIPMLGFLAESMQGERWTVWFKRGVVPIVALIVVVRIVLALNILPERTGLSGYKARMEAYHTMMGDGAVVFRTSFQHPSLYHFYTGQDAALVHARDGHKTGLDDLPYTYRMQGKPATVTVQLDEDTPICELNGYTLPIARVDSLQLTHHIAFDVLSHSIVGDTIRINTFVTNHYDVDFDFAHSELPVSVALLMRHNGELLPCRMEREIKRLSAGESAHCELVARLGRIPVDGFSISLVNAIGATSNSRVIKE